MGTKETREPTPLQADLKPEHLGRSLDEVKRVLSGCSESELMQEIAMRFSWDRPTVVVDGACGTGRSIEEMARTGRIVVEDMIGWRLSMRAIGIDVNPLPHLIPESVLSLDCRTGKQRKKPTLPKAQFRRDDLRTLKTLRSGSVDVLYSVSGLPYVDDTLAALQAGWRVLRQGDAEGNKEGFMVYEVPMMLVSDPDIRKIIATTRGASEVFSTPPRQSPFNDMRDDHPFIVGRKLAGNEFRGFPWRLVGTRQQSVMKNDEPHLKHAVVGIYEPITSDERYVG